MSHVFCVKLYHFVVYVVFVAYELSSRCVCAEFALEYLFANLNVRLKRPPKGKLGEVYDITRLYDSKVVYFAHSEFVADVGRYL